jgi:DNA-binding Lrp family transcriptional regulator
MKDNLIKAIDEKDRKILVELDKDARQTDSDIAKKVRLSKQVTNYSIKHLIERGIISNFYTIINIGKLSYASYYLFLQLQNINEKEERDLLEKIKNKHYVGWIVNSSGKWDVVLCIYAQSTLQFDKAMNEILEICSNKVHEYIFTQLISAEHIGYRFLGEKVSSEIFQSDKVSPFELEILDKKILKELSQNARLTSVEISERINIPLHLVRYHLKSLLKKKIIEGAKPKINISKLGLQWHLLLIQFASIGEKRKKEFIDFCLSHPKFYYVTHTAGQYNLMLDIHVKSAQEFREVLFELKEKYSDVIKTYESLLIFEEYKIDYFTDLFID